MDMQLVMKLKNTTNAGVKDCKEALETTKGDFDKAVALLREKGKATAAKKADRVAAEGKVSSHIQTGNKVGVLVEVNCETDFAAKNELFDKLILNVCDQIIKTKPANETALLAQTYEKDASKTIADVVIESSASIGEKISIRRFSRLEVSGLGRVQSYIHAGGKIGVLVECACGTEPTARKEALGDMLKNVAMQIAAANPLYLDETQVPTGELEREKEILRNKARAENKPEPIIEKMLEGQVKKYYGDICLIHQAYVKDNSKTIKTVVAETAKELNDKIEITRFVRYELGEGIEKKVENFADEVAKASKV
jgi:elongation factor Ts